MAQQQQQQQETTAGNSNVVSDNRLPGTFEAELDVLPPHADPLSALRRFWNWDFCAHPPPPPRMRAATDGTHPTPENDDETTKEGPLWLWEQVHAAWQQFWEDTKFPRGDANNNNNNGLRGRNETTRDDDTMDPTTTTTHHHQWTCIVTEPGTSRIWRIYHGLELFVLTVAVVVATFHMLRHAGIDFRFVVERKE